MALVTNHLRLAKELGTSELLKPTLTKAVVQKTLLGGGGGGEHSNTFQTSPGSDLSLGAKVKGSEE